MAYLTATEQARTIGMRDDVVALMLQLMNATEQRTGKKIYVREDGGFRFNARQLQLWQWAQADAAQGNVYPTAKPGESSHEFGAGFDLGIEGGTDADYRTMQELGRQLGLVVGADFGDPYHFNVNESLETMRATFRASLTRDLQSVAIGAGVSWLATRWLRRRRARRAA